MDEQISELVTEQSLRSLGGQFGKVVDVIISKFTLDEVTICYSLMTRLCASHRWVDVDAFYF